MRAPGFVTNHELDLFLGGGGAGQRQRLRLQKDGLLPKPTHIGRVKRFNIAVFPRFALAGLVRDLGTIPHAAEEMSLAASKLFSTPAFTEMCAAVRKTATTLDAWSFDYLVQGVADLAPDAVQEWTNTVAAAERGLADRFNVVLSTDVGVIKQAVGDACIVSLSTGGAEQVPAGRFAASMEEGRSVALERVRVKAQEMDYVMPLETIPDKQDMELAGWFAEMMGPAKAPAPAVEEVSHHEPLPYRRRSAPRNARWRGASTMTRLPAAG